MVEFDDWMFVSKNNSSIVANVDGKMQNYMLVNQHNAVKESIVGAE